MKALAIACFVALAAGRLAHADDKATAEALFDDAKALVARGDYAAACGKFEASYKFDRAVGTELNLADCHEHLGKLATAWAEYIEVENAAKDLADDKAKDRAAFAHGRVAALAPRLVRLRLDPPASAIAGLVVKRDGEDVTAILGTAVPVDPGAHVVEASARGFRPWSQSVSLVGEGTTTPVQIPVLVAVAVAVAATVATPATIAAPATSVTAAPPEPPEPPLFVDRVGYAFELAGGFGNHDANLGTNINCDIPAHQGASLSATGYLDLAALSWLRVRLGLRFQTLILGYEATSDTPACAGVTTPKNVTEFLFGPVVRFETPFHLGGIEGHVGLGGSLELPAGNGSFETVTGTTPIPGVSFGSPPQGTLELGAGIRVRAFVADVIAQLRPSGASAEFDTNTFMVLMLAVGYSSLK